MRPPYSLIRLESPALKGHNNQAQEDTWESGIVGGGVAPFQGKKRCAVAIPQGVALGWVVVPLRGEGPPPAKRTVVSSSIVIRYLISLIRMFRQRTS
jgi:hypothetical protein